MRTRWHLLAWVAPCAAFTSLAVTFPMAGPNRYGHSDRVERHLLPAVSTGPLDPTFSPDGKWIAFSMRGDIWKVAAGGGKAIALTSGPNHHFEPAWSPDGRRLALSMDVGGNLDIGVVSAEGGGVERITTHRQVDIQPVWDRGGAGLYFVSARRRGFRIYHHTFATGENKGIARGIQPALSADGKRLAFVARVRGRLGSGGLWTMDLPDGEPRLRRYEESAYRMKPAWTPDGRALLYVSDEMGSNDVAIVAAAGGNPVVLTADGQGEYAPAPSPDGKRIAFVSNRGGPTRLYTVGMGGGPPASWREVAIRRSPRVPHGRVRVRVLGPGGKAVPARVQLLASDGRAYAPDGGFHRVIAATETHYFHTAGEAEVELPAGPASIEAMRGFEYRPRSVKVEVPAGEVIEVDIQLERLLDLPARGWYSGDTHVHDLHQGRFGLTHETFFQQLMAEDLHVTNALIHMDGTRLMGRWGDLTGKPHPLSTPDYILQYGEEFRGSLGHIALLGIREYVLPFTGGVPGTAYAAPAPDWIYLDAARAQGGIAGFVHPFPRRVYQPSVAARSLIPVDAALGKGDFYDVGALWSDERASTGLYYRLLNCGFRIAATAGTDNFSDVWRDPPPGADRTYVRVEGALTFAKWIDGIRAQRTFGSTGPLLFLQVDGRQPGEEIALHDRAGDSLRVRAEAVSIAPMDQLDIVVNGEVAKSVRAADPLRVQFDGAVAIPEGGWIAARVVGPSSRYISDSYAFAQTSPVYVVRNKRPFTSAADARFLEAAVDALWSRIERRGPWSSPAAREEFRGAVDRARTVYRKIAGREK